MEPAEAAEWIGVPLWALLIVVVVAYAHWLNKVRSSPVVDPNHHTCA